MANSSAPKTLQHSEKKSPIPQDRSATRAAGELSTAPQYAPGNLLDIARQYPEKLSPKQLLQLQSSFGNRAIGQILQCASHGNRRVNEGIVRQVLTSPFAIQRSELSDELERIWSTNDKEAFFARLRNLGQSDQDVSDFVERTLTGADLQRARRIMGTVPLSDAQRLALYTRLGTRLSTAVINYHDACQQVHERIQAEERARAELVMLIIGAVITYVTPGLGVAVTSLATEIPWSASAATSIITRSGAIASAIGEVGKRAALPVVRSALASSDRSILNALAQGFNVAIDTISGHIYQNICNRDVLPDEDLWAYVSNWDPRVRTLDTYIAEISDTYERYSGQVLSITPGEPYAGYGPYGIPLTSRTPVWVRHPSGDILVLVDYRYSSVDFNTFVDEDMKESALARADIRNGPRTYNWEQVNGMPSPNAVPSTVARR